MRRSLASVVCALAIVVGACVPAAEESSPPAGASAGPAATALPREPITVRIGSFGDVYTKDPAQSLGVNIGRISPTTNIFEPLTTITVNNEVVPLLAESFEYDESTNTWTFHLRPNVTFHNGTPLTAEAVVATFDKALETANLKNLLALDQGAVSAVDDLTVEFRSKAPNWALPANVGTQQLGIFAPDADYLEEYVGTGPFKFVEWVKDDHFTMEKYDGYWGAPAQVDTIEFRFIPDANARMLALQAGEVDLVPGYAVQNSLIKALGSGFEAVAVESTGLVNLNVVLTRDGNPLKDIRLREAIGFALNRQVFIDDLDGYASAEQTLLPPLVFGEYVDTIKGYTYDPDRAGTLLDEAGWRDSDGDGIREQNGEPLRIEIIAGYPSQAALNHQEEIVQAQLREVGIDVVLVVTSDTPSALDAVTTKKGDIWMSGATFNTGFCGIINQLWRAEPGANWGPFAAAVAPYHAGVLTTNEAAVDCNAASTVDELQESLARGIRGVVDEARSVIPIIRPQQVWLWRDGLNFEPPWSERYVNYTLLSASN